MGSTRSLALDTPWTNEADRPQTSRTGSGNGRLELAAYRANRAHMTHAFASPRDAHGDG